MNGVRRGAKLCVADAGREEQSLRSAFGETELAEPACHETLRDVADGSPGSSDPQIDVRGERVRRLQHLCSRMTTSAATGGEWERNDEKQDRDSSRVDAAELSLLTW